MAASGHGAAPHWTHEDHHTPEEIRDHVKDDDIELRNSKSGSVPPLDDVLDAEERRVLIDDTFLEDAKRLFRKKRPEMEPLSSS